MGTNKQIIEIESGKTFAECCLWDVQREYYSQHGIEAWAGEVPFYITSNPYIAHCYADMVVHFLQEWFIKHPDKLSEPVTILELGVGPGQFSFYVLKALKSLLAELKCPPIEIRYIMSDLSANKFEFWRNHHALKPFVDEGILDFAVFDFENDTEIKTDISQRTLDPHSLQNPLIVFANYVFDSISTDIFSVSDAELQATTVSLSTTATNYHDGKVLNWEKVDFQHNQVSVEENQYHNKVIDRILKGYKDALIDTHFQFPVGSLRGLQKLQALSDGNLLMISSDKGFTSIDELEGLDYPELDFHGSFSVMVNYHAIGEFFKSTEGSALLQPQREGIVTGIFTSGFTLEDFPSLQVAAKEHIHGFTPADYYINYEYVSDHPKRFPLQMLTSQLCLSRWDPYFYCQIKDRLYDLLDNADAEVITYLADHMPDLWSNFYYMPESDDVAFEIAVFYHEQERYEEALDFYKKSLQFYDEGFAVIYNLAFCQYYIGEKHSAFDNFQRAIEIRPKSKETKEWLNKVKKELNL